MKMAITYEYADILETIEKMLAANGAIPQVDDEGEKLINFDHKKKEVVIQCELAPVPDACPFCQRGVNPELPTKQNSSTQANKDESEQTEATANDDDRQANTVELEEGGEPMSMAQLHAQSGALSRKEGPIKVQRGAEAHATLAKPSTLEGETTRNPFANESGD